MGLWDWLPFVGDDKYIRPLPDMFFEDAAKNIGIVRRQRGESSVDDKGIEKLLRAYVDLGRNEKIRDYYRNLNENDKQTIIAAVQKRTQEMYGFTPNAVKSKIDLELLDELAKKGLANPLVAYPRKGQTELDAMLKQQRDEHPVSFEKGLEVGMREIGKTVGGAVSAGTQGLAAGLGLSKEDLLKYGAIAIGTLITINMLTRR